MHGLLNVHVFVLAAFSFSTLALTSCGSGICENKVIEEYISIEGENVATLFERSCGAPSPIVKVVGLRKISEEFNPERHENWVFTIHGYSEIDVSWKGKDSLHISYSHTGDKPTTREIWNQIRVTYN